MANWTEEEYRNLMKNRPPAVRRSSVVLVPKQPVKAKETVPTEHYEQCQVIKFRDENLGQFPSLKWLHAIPNGQAKTPGQRMKFKREGLTSGVSDLCLPDPRGGYYGLYIEMKRLKGGKVSDEQKEFIEFVKARNYFVKVAEGGDVAIAILKRYLALPARVERAIELADQLF